MDGIVSLFDSMMGLHDGVFGRFPDVHFLVRTVFLLLLAWLVALVALKTFKYAAGPLAVLLFYHAALRLHNYFFVETPAEWLYIRYYSKDLPAHEKTYLRLADKSKRYREAIKDMDYGMAVVRVRGAERRLSRFALTAVTLLVAAFSLYAEFFPPGHAAEGGGPGHAAGGENAPENSPQEGDAGGGANPQNPAESPEPPEPPEPPEWESGTRLALNAEGRRAGAWLRDGPGIGGTVVVEVLWGDDVVEYMRHYVPDEYVRGLFWLRVRTRNGNTGYLSSSLVDVYGGP